jgi:tetratricopeptide (TPR) repeat protein
MNALRDRELQTLAVTFDNGNFDGGISLDVRFMQYLLTRSVEAPETLDQPVQVNWKRQTDIIYLSNFFKKDETRELVLAMNADEPNAAWIKFALYRSSVEHKKGSDALLFLAEAVNLDKVYALEYLALSDMAYEKQRPDEAMRMLSLASEAFPENVQIKLKMAHLAAAMGEKETALTLVEQLQQQEWSLFYYPDMLTYLENLAAFINSDATAITQEIVSPEEDPRRQRILK